MNQRTGVGRGGIRQWLAENAPDLSERYKTVMKYKALAKRFRQAVGLSDPVPASAVLPPEPPADPPGDGGVRREESSEEGDMREHSSDRSRARELLARCEGTVASLAAQLALMVSPEYVESENTVRTEIAAGAGRGDIVGRGRSSA